MSDQSTSDNHTDISETDIVSYLRNNPGFFTQHPGLLAELTLPHESGTAVSLVERQVSILRERNIDVRHRLTKLLDNARDNDRLFDKTKRLTLAMLEGRDLADIVDALYYSFDNDFKIHYTSLILFGSGSKLPDSNARVESLSTARDHIANILRNNRPVCGELDAKVVKFLFPDQKKQIGSMALAPLIHGNTFGVLAIANRDPNYYRSSMGTLFLSYIAEVLNRLLPHHLPR